MKFPPPRRQAFDQQHRKDFLEIVCHNVSNLSSSYDQSKSIFESNSKSKSKHQILILILTLD